MVGVCEGHACASSDRRRLISGYAASFCTIVDAITPRHPASHPGPGASMLLQGSRDLPTIVLTRLLRFDGRNGGC